MVLVNWFFFRNGRLVGFFGFLWWGWCKWYVVDDLGFVDEFCGKGMNGVLDMMMKVEFIYKIWN